jgi:DNA-binding IclR family transcriptional regulator
MANPSPSKARSRKKPVSRTARPGSASSRTSGDKTRDKPKRNIQSIEVGFKLIRALEEAPGPMSLKLLSQRAGMEPSKAHLYLVSFCNLGLVAQEDTGYYALGAYALQLGLAALNKIDLAHLARKALHELRDETGEAASLAIHGDKGPVIVAKADGLKDDPLVIRLGRTLRISNSAAGRVFLAFSKADSVRHQLNVEIERGEVTAALAKKLRHDVQERGYARADALAHAGFSALAAPVFDHEGRLAGAITLLGLSASFPASAEGHLSQVLMSKTRQLSFQLGFRV